MRTAGKAGGRRAGRHDVVHRKLMVAAVEIAHLAGFWRGAAPTVRRGVQRLMRSKSTSSVSVFLKRRGRIVSCIFPHQAEKVRPAWASGFGPEEAGNAN